MNHTSKQVRWALLMSLILLCFCVNAQANALQASSATPSPAAETQYKSGEKGITYATPGFPVGGNRPYDCTFKSGLKKIW